jgi:serine protease Do
MNGRPSLGVILTEVPEGSSGKAAGLREGDIVQSVAGVGVGDLRGFARLLAIQPLDEPVALTVWRSKAQITVNPVVKEWLSGEQIDQAAVAKTLATHWGSMDLGLKLEALTAATRQSSKLPADSPGVIVDAVAPFSVASDRGLKVGDVILKVQDQVVTRPDQVLGQVGSMMGSKRELVLLLVHGPSGQRWVPLPLVHP